LLPVVWRFIISALATLTSRFAPRIPLRKTRTLRCEIITRDEQRESPITLAHRALMYTDTGQEIANLINDRNKLTKKYAAEKVLESAENYICRFASDGRLVGVVVVPVRNLAVAGAELDEKLNERFVQLFLAAYSPLLVAGLMALQGVRVTARVWIIVIFIAVFALLWCTYRLWKMITLRRRIRLVFRVNNMSAKHSIN
jgi:hypothetical protein